MGKYIVEFTPAARKDLQKHYQSGNKSFIKKIEKMLLELTETPYIGEGKPEELKYHYRGLVKANQPKRQNGISCRGRNRHYFCCFCYRTLLR